MASLFFLFIGCSSSTNNNAIAHIKDNGTFEVNDDKAKDKMLNDLRAVVKNFHVDSVNVKSVMPIGEKHAKVYFLQLTG